MLNKRKNIKGFSLIELVVTSSVFLIIVVLSGQLIRLAGFDSQVNTNLNEVQQNSRVALKFLERDITNNGDNYLIGLAGGQGLVGPLISLNAFKNIRGSNGLNSGNNLPTMGNNKQPLFSLLPVRRVDNLANGAASSTPSQTIAENSSADRLTVAYEDEFFVAGTQATYATMTARNNATALTGTGETPVNTDEEFEGFWTRPTSGVPVPVLRLTPKNVDTTDLSGTTTYTKIFYNVNDVKPGDIFKLSTGTTEVLAIVSDKTLGGADQLNNPPTLKFELDALTMNQANNATSIATTTASIQALNPISPTFNIDRDNLLNPLYPLDFLPVTPGTTEPAPNTIRIKATRVLIYTYKVDIGTRDLVRRHYTYKPNSDPVGNAMIDDPVCQNVDRFWVSFNLIVPANPPTTTIPSLGNETDLDPDATQTDYGKLQNVRRVNVSLILRSTEIDRRTRQPSRVGIQASFSPRNIVYQINENAS